jgi:hypothetical protein
MAGIKLLSHPLLVRKFCHATKLIQRNSKA